MFRLFVSRLFVIHSDFGIALSVGDARHCKIHTHLVALAVEIHAESVDNVLRSAFGNAYNVLGSPLSLSRLLHKLTRGRFAKRAKLGRRVSFMYVTANRTNKLFHFFNLLVKIFYFLSGIPDKDRKSSACCL